MLELYRRIRHRREELKMSQDELAKKVGYKSRTSIHKIEQGKVDLQQSKISEIAIALDTTPEYLMGWTALTQKPINAEEMKLVNGYRWLAPADKNFVLSMIERLRGVAIPEAANVSIKQNNENGSNFGTVGGNFSSQVTMS